MQAVTFQLIILWPQALHLNMSYARYVACKPHGCGAKMWHAPLALRLCSWRYVHHCSDTKHDPACMLFQLLIHDDHHSMSLIGGT